MELSFPIGGGEPIQDLVWKLLMSLVERLNRESGDGLLVLPLPARLHTNHLTAMREPLRPRGGA